MGNDKILEALRVMLPPCVCVAAGPQISGRLTVRESASLGEADEYRIREFASGRGYAKRALAMLGMGDVDVPVGPMRAPSWPEGVVGSITHVPDHGSGIFAAAVARAENILAIGIDVEREDALHPRSWRHFMTRRELDRICGYPADRRRAEALFLWCAKEATTKMVRQPVDPSRIEIERDAGGDDFTASFADDIGMPFVKEMVGHTGRAEGFFFAAAFVPGELNQQALQ